MNVYPAKVNRTVEYRVPHPADGRMTVRPAVITVRINDNTADLRVGHHGETYAGVVRRTGDRGVNNAGWNDNWMPT